MEPVFTRALESCEGRVYTVESVAVGRDVEVADAFVDELGRGRLVYEMFSPHGWSDGSGLGERTAAGSSSRSIV